MVDILGATSLALFRAFMWTADDTCNPHDFNFPRINVFVLHQTWQIRHLKGKAWLPHLDSSRLKNACLHALNYFRPKRTFKLELDGYPKHSDISALRNWRFRFDCSTS